MRRQDQRAFGDRAVQARSRLARVQQAGIVLADQVGHAAQHALEAGQRFAQRDAVAADHEFPDRVLVRRPCAS